MRIFLAGIMQGSHRSAEMHEQDYRARLKRLLRDLWPEAETYDPLADHADSLDYSPDRAREVFLKHNRMCGQTDLLIAFVPEASMGTAIEMWEAHVHQAVVATISPLKLNWAIRFCSDFLYEDFTAFETDLAAGTLRRKTEELLRLRRSDQRT